MILNRIQLTRQTVGIHLEELPDNNKLDRNKRFLLVKECSRHSILENPNPFSNPTIVYNMMIWLLKQARVAEDGSSRSFIVQRDDGTELLRNSKYLKHHWKNPRVKKHIKHVSWVADGAESAENIEAADVGNGGPAL